MSRNKILVVDDEPGIRFGIRKFLGSKGYNVLEAFNCEKAKEIFRNSQPDAAIIDYSLPDGTALDLLSIFKEIAPDVPLLILTAHGSIELAVKAIKQGAEQFLTKPIELPALLVILERLLENHRNRQKLIANKTQQARKSLNPFLGSSPLIQQLKERVERVINADSPILILGETGTGKGVLAKWIHENSSRSDEAFVDLNCAGLTKEFLETELFGHEKGAFTDARNRRIGLFEEANFGTLFLDEVGELSPAAQVKLLRVLEDSTFTRVGANETIKVDVRIIAATNVDLKEAIERGRFRADLYYRLNVYPIRLPALRDRKEDIPLLAMHFLELHSKNTGKPFSGISDDALQLLKAYDWPGNVRELDKVIQRAAISAKSRVLTVTDFLSIEAFQSLVTEKSTEKLKLEIELGTPIEIVERRLIEQTLAYTQGDKSRAANMLGIGRKTLYRKLEEYQKEK